MEWSSTKLPVTAQPCKITAVCLAGLGGGREEAERELWLLKVPCADPLLHLGSAAHPSVFPWHSEGASQGDTAPHKRGGLSDGDNKRELAARAVSLTNTKPMTALTAWSLVVFWGEDRGESLGALAVLSEQHPLTCQGCRQSCGHFLSREQPSLSNQVPLSPCRGIAFCLINVCW